MAAASGWLDRGRVGMLPMMGRVGKDGLLFHFWDAHLSSVSDRGSLQGREGWLDLEWRVAALVPLDWRASQSKPQSCCQRV